MVKDSAKLGQNINIPYLILTNNKHNLKAVDHFPYRSNFQACTVIVI